LTFLLKGKVYALRAFVTTGFIAGGSDGYGRDLPTGISGVVGGQAVVRVVTNLMLDGVALRVREKHLPGPPCIATPPESRVAGIDYPQVRRIKGKGTNATAKIEHTPGLAIVVRDVTAGHVTVLKN
jgi:hypothetical protein